MSERRQRQSRREVIDPGIADQSRGHSGDAGVSFSGTGWRMAGLLIPGYVLMLPTLGLYRFWQLTHKRQYYWSRTVIDGDNLEYTGTASQLLVGFLIALIVFVPFAILYLWLSLQDQDLILIGYVGAGATLFFLAGYAQYRARRFRLTRTLWRGLRFSQEGSAFRYAVRRIFWWILVIATAGLAYPAMRVDLFRYGWNRTYFGNRRVQFTGNWRMLYGPFIVVLVCFALIGALAIGASTATGSALSPQQAVGIAIVPTILLGLGAYFYLRARFLSKLYSALTIGETQIRVHVKARTLLWHGVIFVFWMVLSLILVGILVALVMALFSMPPELIGTLRIDDIGQLGGLQIGLAIVGYLAVLAWFSLLAESLLSQGYWQAIANGTQLKNAKDLRSVRRGEADESPVIGEGLADALNVGAY